MHVVLLEIPTHLSPKQPIGFMCGQFHLCVRTFNKHISKTSLTSYSHGLKMAKLRFVVAFFIVELFPSKVMAGFPLSGSHKVVLNIQKMIQKNISDFVCLGALIMPGKAETNVAIDICGKRLKTRLKTLVSFF